MDAETTVEQARQDFLLNIRTRKLSRHTYRAYASDLRDFERFAGSERTAQSCDKPFLEEYIRHLLEERKLKETSVKRRIACLRLLFNWLEDEERLERNPFHRLRTRIKLPKRLPRTLTEAEIRALLVQPARELGILNGGGYRLDSLPRRLHDDDFVRFGTLVAIELLFATGIRVGELVRIETTDIDLKTGIIEIYGKGDRQRRVFLPDQATTRLLDQYLAVRKKRIPQTKKLLIQAQGQPVSTAHVRHWLRQAAEKAGITRRITPHMLRHTAATQLLKAGIDIRAVQRVLGHASILTTQLYTEVADHHLQALIRDRHPRRRILASGGLYGGSP